MTVQGEKHQIAVRYPDVRHTLFIEIYHTTTLAMETTAMDIVLEHISKLPEGAAPQTFGFVHSDELIIYPP